MSDVVNVVVAVPNTTKRSKSIDKGLLLVCCKVQTVSTAINPDENVDRILRRMWSHVVSAASKKS